MTSNNYSFNASELCSRKLWQMISSPSTQTPASELHAAVSELAQRRHYLEELQKIGKLKA